MRNPFRYARNELRSCHGGAITAGALILGIVWLIVLSIVGSPRLLLLWITARILVPPTWLFLVFMLLLFLVSGAFMGAVLGDRRRGCDAVRYRGAFFSTVAITMCYLWYALFFGARFFFSALLLSAIASLCFFVAAITFRRGFRVACVGAWLCFGVCLYLTLLSLLCFLLL